MGPPRVGWFEWSDAAFEKARAEDKPVILSIGAAWCHGCRVMDEQTYGDPEIAGLLNRDYVPVRVDSDRRPDINDRYNLGGWPTTAFLTPGADLMGGATYLDVKQMKQLLVQLKAGYEANRESIAEEIARRDEKIAEATKLPETGPVKLGREIFRKTVRGIVGTFDQIHAGFGKAPKFPLVSSLRVVLHALDEMHGPDFEMVLLRTLDAMGDRGMYDAVDGGFFHYATNDVWSAPRFEKLTDDNAALIGLYLDASEVTGQEKYRAKAVHALEWVRKTLLEAERGAFRGSQFADERYYTASPEERARRPRPDVDRTVFTTGCAAMASAFLRAAEVLEDASFSEPALLALDFLLKECVKDEGVAHYHDGAPAVFSLARDRIALGSALLDAHDHAGDPRYLDAAESVTAPLATEFWSDAEKGLVDRKVDDVGYGELSRLKRHLHETALAAENFARLWRKRGDEAHRLQAERLITSYPDLLDSYGHATAEYALAADWLVREPEEVSPAPGALRPFVARRVVRHAGG